MDLARLMGGDISVQSQPGVGSSFTLHLHLPAVTAPEHPSGPLSTVGSGLAGLSILAADDVEVNRLVLADLLTHEGAHVVFAENGQQVLERLDRAGVTAFDLVLMDVQMPVMDGFEATRRIHAIAPALPVVGLTAYALADEREKCLAAGMVDVVTKPINIKVLVAAIRRQVQLHDGPEPLPAAHTMAADAVAASTTETVFEKSPIDWAALLARFNGRRGFVKTLAAAMRENFVETPAKLRAAAEAHDLVALNFIAHSLKGANLEARQLHDLTQTFEASLRVGIDIGPDSVEALVLALEAVLAELADFVNSEGDI
jgi:CheY-like chemotaxis protein